MNGNGVPSFRPNRFDLVKGGEVFLVSREGLDARVRCGWRRDLPIAAGSPYIPGPVPRRDEFIRQDVGRQNIKYVNGLPVEGIVTGFAGRMISCCRR